MIKYVDKKNKICLFGHGAIDISVTMGTSIQLREITPPMNAGTHIWTDNGESIGDWCYTGNNIFITVSTLDEIETIMEHLNTIENDCGGSFKFKDVVFDFTTYSQSSLNVVKSTLERVLRNMISVMAC